MVSTAINNVEINADMMNLIATYGRGRQGETDGGYFRKT